MLFLLLSLMHLNAVVNFKGKEEDENVNSITKENMRQSLKILPGHNKALADRRHMEVFQQFT